MADGSEGSPVTLRTFADVLKHAASRGVTLIETACALHAAYDEDGEREHHSATVHYGPNGRQCAVGRGRTHEDAVVTALQLAGVTW